MPPSTSHNAARSTGAHRKVQNNRSGEILLDTSFLDGPVTINFATPIQALGFNIAHENFGAFTGTMQFFGAGNTLFGTVNVNGTSSNANDGSAPFLGGASTAADIVSVVISVNSSGGSRAFAINQMSLVAGAAPPTTPEPATISLFAGAALAAFAGKAISRRRSSNNRA